MSLFLQKVEFLLPRLDKALALAQEPLLVLEVEQFLLEFMNNLNVRTRALEFLFNFLSS